MDAGDERYWAALIAWWLVSLLEVMLACAGERSGWLSFFAEWPGWCAVMAISPFFALFRLFSTLLFSSSVRLKGVSFVFIAFFFAARHDGVCLGTALTDTKSVNNTFIFGVRA